MDTNPIRVLLVDDEEDLVQFLAKRLGRKGFDVATATSGPEALRQAAAARFDVVVVDLKMPEMDGIEVLRRLKAIDRFIQVVMLTGHGSLDTALESGRHDAFRFLAKPAAFGELVEILQEAHQARRRALRQAFNAEIAEVIAGRSDPREILQETKRLREKYEQSGD